MDNYEEYLLKVLQRTNAGLQDSLVPLHAGKLARLVEKLESAPSLVQEVERLQKVAGFAKCALAMQWLMEKTRHANAEISPEQFESDVLMMNEKLFEAFLNQPFDMPNFASQTSSDAPPRQIQKDIQLSDDEFLLVGESSPQPDIRTEPEQEQQISADPIEEWKPAVTDTFAEALMSATEEVPTDNISPALSEVMNEEFFESTKNLAQLAIDFALKQPGERPIAMAVMRVSAKASVESAKTSNNVVIQEFFASLVALINFADKEGKIKSESFAEIINDIGDRLLSAVNDSSNGINVLTSLTEFIKDPKELLSTR